MIPIAQTVVVQTRSSRRNLGIIFVDSVLFNNAMTFLSVNAFITYFLAGLHASTFQIGLANALVPLGAFITQPFFANRVMRLPTKKISFFRTLSLQRVIFLVFVLCLPLFSRLPHPVVVIVFLMFWGVFNLFVGAYNPYYSNLFAKLISPSQRGRLRGFSGATANLLSLGSAFAGGAILKSVVYPFNYELIFLVGIVLLLLDAGCFWLMDEHEIDSEGGHMNYLQYLTYVPSLFRECPSYKRVVGGFTGLVVAQLPFSYDVLYAIRDFHAGAATIATFTAINSLVNILGNILFGFLADARGHRFIISVAAICGLMSGLLPMLFHSIPILMAGFALSGLCVSGYNLSGSIMIMERVPHEKLPLYISFNSVITLAISALLTLLGSWLITELSFMSIFLLACLGGLVAYVFVRSA